MSLTSIKNLKRDEGFTLVELLIVIVVIGILAAITLVAYNGVQQKAHDSALDANASMLIKKAALYQTETGNYPSTFATLTSLAQSDPANIPTGTITLLTAAPSAYTTDTSLAYYTCGSPITGVQVKYWSPASGVTNPVVLSNGVTTGTCTISTT